MGTNIKGLKCASCGHVGEAALYDEDCYDLADKFLPNGTELERDDLATAIQTHLEEWLELHGKQS